MFEKSINQIEWFFPGLCLFFVGGYWYMIFDSDLERTFEYDIHVSIILFLISIVLGYKKITANNRGITKSPYLIPSLKKPKLGAKLNTWHMLHLGQKASMEELPVIIFCVFLTLMIKYALKLETNQESQNTIKRQNLSKPLQESLRLIFLIL